MIHKLELWLKISFEEKIIFTGYQSDVESIMNCCDIGVLSTFREGISNSVLEFMALGKPMIVTGGGGTLELIENSVSGIIIESGDHELLAEKIMSLLDNPDEMEKMGTLAKKRIETKFSMDKMTESFLSIYNSFSKN